MKFEKIEKTETVKIGNLNFRTFAKTDWSAFAGAENFPNGDSPIIADSENGKTIVVSGGGFEVSWEENEELEYVAFGTIFETAKEAIEGIGNLVSAFA